MVDAAVEVDGGGEKEANVLRGGQQSNAVAKYRAVGERNKRME